MKEPNNEHGTYDHDFTSSRPMVRDRKMRSESHPDGGDATYYLDGEDGTCQGATYGDWGYHGCSNRGKHEYRGISFCKIHHPPTRFRKRQERDAKHRAEYDRKRERWQYDDALKAWREKALKALETISEGELNDPAGYAQMILDERPAPAQED